MLTNVKLINVIFRPYDYKRNIYITGNIVNFGRDKLNDNSIRYVE